MTALYFGGILMGLLMALLLRGTMFRGEAVPFVMELPNYRLPGAKNVCQLLWDKAKDFLQRAFTVIFWQRSSSGSFRPLICALPSYPIPRRAFSR